GVACMGGGGVRLGQVVGATNALGEVVVDSPVSPQDLAATIYHTLGIPLHTWYRAQDGRPIELCPEGRPIRQLVGCFDPEGSGRETAPALAGAVFCCIATLAVETDTPPAKGQFKEDIQANGRGTGLAMLHRSR